MKKIILILSVAFLFNGCATNDTYRQMTDTACPFIKKGECVRNSIQLHNTSVNIEDNEYTLGFVEIND